MEFRELQYFLVVAAEGNISAAAQKLHVAQPSLSRQMKELEQKLGKTLFYRGARKISLTEEGRILQKRATEMLQLMARTDKAPRSAPSCHQRRYKGYHGTARERSSRFRSAVFSRRS